MINFFKLKTQNAILKLLLFAYDKLTKLQLKMLKELEKENQQLRGQLASGIKIKNGQLYASN